MKPTELFASQVVKASPAKVFEAWTTPVLLRQWWGPPPYSCPVAEIDLRVGGAYRLANQSPDGDTIWITGVFTRVEAPSALSYTWKLSTWDTEASLLHVAFLPHPVGTEVRVHHERFHDAAARKEHTLGWQGCLYKLQALLES